MGEYFKTSSEKNERVGQSFAQYAGSTQIILAQRNDTHWNHLIFLKVNIIIWIKEESAITEKFSEIFSLPHEQQMQVAMRRCPLRENYSHRCMENKHTSIKLSYISSDIYGTYLYRTFRYMNVVYLNLQISYLCRIGCSVY